jgi:hypothetical protein
MSTPENSNIYLIESACDVHIITWWDGTGSRFYLGNEGDWSVGIPSVQLTPDFYSKEELMEYVESSEGFEKIKWEVFNQFGEEAAQELIPEESDQ